MSAHFQLVAQGFGHASVQCTALETVLRKLCSERLPFALPASERQLIAVEQALGCGLPMLLREFLLEADGAGVSPHNFPIIWSSAEIQKQNQEFRNYAGFRELYMPFDHLLFFAADGGGDQFAYAIQADGKIHGEDVFRWEHETDARSWYARSLWQFLEKRLKPGVTDDC